MVTIAIINQKGGIGKTTTAVTLAHGASLRGFRVLLVDLDTQGNVADSMGLASNGDLYRWLWDEIPTPDVAMKARARLDVIRSNKTTEALKLALTGRTFREQVIRSALESADYDYVIMDCAPSVDILQTAAIVAAQYLVIPTRLDQLSVKGVREVTASIAALCRLGINPTVAGIIPTMMDRVTVESRDQLRNMVEHFGRLVWPTVPQDTTCREATRAKQTLWEYAPECNALVGFQNGAKTNPRIGGYIQVLDRMLEVCRG